MQTEPYNWGGVVALTDANFQTAVNLWFSNQTEANSTYGHISDWDVSAVTDMNGAFSSRSSFNENISGWDVSSVVTMNDMFEGGGCLQPRHQWLRPYLQ